MQNYQVGKELIDNLYFIPAPSRFLDRPRRAWDDSDIIGYRTMSTLANFPGKSFADNKPNGTNFYKLTSFYVLWYHARIQELLPGGGGGGGGSRSV